MVNCWGFFFFFSFSFSPFPFLLGLWKGWALIASKLIGTFVHKWSWSKISKHKPRWVNSILIALVSSCGTLSQANGGHSHMHVLHCAYVWKTLWMDAHYRLDAHWNALVWMCTLQMPSCLLLFLQTLMAWVQQTSLHGFICRSAHWLCHNMVTNVDGQNPTVVT